MSGDESSNEQGAAQSLRFRIQRVVKEVEREFGVYIAGSGELKLSGGNSFWLVRFDAHVWPEAMRIIETERESKAIG